MVQQSLPAWASAILLLAVVAISAIGCGSGGPQMGEVTGNVAYQDGTPPTGGVAVIRFEPVGRSAEGFSKAASADINQDGSYELQTIKPGDGALYGTYKVVFTILDSYRSGKPLVAEQYTSAETTPLEVVVDASSQTFDFEIQRP